MEDKLADTLPSALNVLDKLKSEGTFDRFRKTCLAAIEEEPSFRAQKEHVEVLSRRFLQTFDVKEGKTKNEMRTKLRNFVTDEIRKPDVQISQPVDKLIQKTLESKCPELFQQILDIIDKMQTPLTSLPAPLTDNKTNLPPPEPLLYDSNRVPEHSNTSGPPTTSSTMEMPIDLLELSTFANPLKRDIKKSIKGKSKSETREKHQKGSNSKQESTERNHNVKQSDISNKITADPSAADIETCNISKTILTTDGDKITSSSSTGYTNTNNTYTNISSIGGLEDDDDECCDTLSDSNESGSIPLSSASVIDEGEGPNTTIQDGVPTVVRRSARLASIEEERKETARQLQEQGSNSSSGGSNRGDGSDLDNEGISDEDCTNDDDTLTEEMVYDVHYKTRASSRPSRKRRPWPVVSSDSDSEGIEDEQTVVEVVRGRGNTKRRRIGHVTTGQRSRVNESSDNEVKGISNEKKLSSGRETRRRKN